MKKARLINQMCQLIDEGEALFGLMGNSGYIQTMVQKINQVAETDYTVIIEGETGTGKELIAHAIHKQSKRRDKPFIAVDCGALSESLIESEFFGHKKGAFTGAHRDKEGCFALANNGTLFLDEISNLSLSSQGKFLRALEEKRIHPVGSERHIDIDVRIIAASNICLNADERFRIDLFHRLNEFCIILTPLRERKEDIIFLAERFVRDACGELKKTSLKFSDEAMELLVNYPWPGNVRELRNTVRRAALLADNVIGPEQMALKTRADNMEDVDRAEPAITLRDVSNKATAEAERSAIQHALKTTNGNKSKAAKLLNIDYKTLHYKIKNLGIQANKRL